MESGLRVLVKDKTLKAGCFSQVGSQQVHTVDWMIFQNTKHIIFLPWLKTLKEFPQLPIKSKCSSLGGKHFIIRSLSTSTLTPQTSQAQTNSWARSIKPQEVYRHSCVHFLTPSLPPHPPPHPLTPSPCSLASSSSQFFCYHLSGETSWPSTLLLRPILNPSLVFVPHCRKGYKTTQHCCSPLFALPFEGGPRTMGTS